MTPKTKRRLKWEATRFDSGNDYTVEKWSSCWRAFMWSRNEPYVSRFKTKRQAIEACERHARSVEASK